MWNIKLQRTAKCKYVALQMCDKTCKMRTFLEELQKLKITADVWELVRQKVKENTFIVAEAEMKDSSSKQKKELALTRQQLLLEISKIVTIPIYNQAMRIAIARDNSDVVPSSSKRLKTEHVNSSTDYEDNFRCPMCMCYFGERIFQCSNGHSICEKCKGAWAPCITCKCPTCSVESEFSMRNRTLETISVSTKLPCEYKSNSCPYEGVFHEREKHIQSCRFVDLTCPVDGCGFFGTSESVCQHIKQSHSVCPDKNDSCNRILCSVDCGASDFLLPMYFDKQLFVLKLVSLPHFKTTSIACCLIHPYAKTTSSHVMHVMITNANSDTFSLKFRNIVPCSSIGSVPLQRFEIGWIPTKKTQKIDIDVYVTDTHWEKQ